MLYNLMAYIALLEYQLTHKITIAYDCFLPCTILYMYYIITLQPIGLSLLCQHNYEHNRWQKH